MIWLLLLQSPIQTVNLAPPVPLRDAISLRRQPGTHHLPQIVETLTKCSLKQRVNPPWETALEIRIVHQTWLDQLSKMPHGAHRRGRYYPARNGHPSLIYVAIGRDAPVSLAHEWLHHLASIYRRDWPESWVEEQALKCALRSP